MRDEGRASNRPGTSAPLESQPQDPGSGRSSIPKMVGEPLTILNLGRFFLSAEKSTRGTTFVTPSICAARRRFVRKMADLAGRWFVGSEAGPGQNSHGRNIDTMIRPMAVKRILTKRKHGQLRYGFRLGQAEYRRGLFVAGYRLLAIHQCSPLDRDRSARISQVTDGGERSEAARHQRITAQSRSPHTPRLIQPRVESKMKKVRTYLVIGCTRAARSPRYESKRQTSTNEGIIYGTETGIDRTRQRIAGRS